ncbi:hypothetical protein BGW41_001667 [Actinomortierella wolfii]|nr:hypothetical protein BGW41_001667 [Actinomortierella wolfii]
MKVFALLATLAAYASAAHFIFDVYPEDNGAISFFGNLRYLDPDPHNRDPLYIDCKGKFGVWVVKGSPGGYSWCDGMKVSVGLYFPKGFNGTISEAYDFNNKLRYPCTIIDRNSRATTYICTDIDMRDLYLDDSDA